jgi:hypothetical protein
MLVFLSFHGKKVAWILSTIFYLEFILTPTRMMAGQPNKRVVFDILHPANNVLGSTAQEVISDKRPFFEKAGANTPDHLRKMDHNARGPFTTGPTQPEMSTFQSVNANNMVDLFTGDFSYNIPLLDVGGYPVNIHYQSGITMDQDASWAGLGWNINPGTISRNMRGLPDDFSGEETVAKTLSMKENRTVGVNLSGSIEYVGLPINLRAGIGVFHNSYKGWGSEVSLNAGITSGSGSKGVMSAGLGITNNSQDGLDVSPSIGFQQAKSDNVMLGLSLGTNYNSRMGIQNLQMTGQMSLSNYDRKKFSGSATGYLSFSKPSHTPRVTIPFTSDQFAFTLKGGAEFTGASVGGYIRGYGSAQRILPGDTTKTIPAYGYIYSEKASGNPDVLLDFNRDNDLPYNEKTPNIAVPIHTYDTYSISGEGTSGMFRPYRNDLGFTFDHAMRSGSISNSFSAESSFGTVLHAGVDLQRIEAITANAPWQQNNRLVDIAKFSSRDTSYENVYFKNPGEKGRVNSEYLEKIGGDNLIRLDLQPASLQNVPNVSLSRNFSIFKNGTSSTKGTFSTTALRKERDRRTQVISWLTAKEASQAALDKKIKSYPINVFPGVECNGVEEINRVDTNRRENHLSEITVLNTDGRRYVYGVPAYSLVSKDYTFSVDSKLGNRQTGLVTYSRTDRSAQNKQGKENYFSKEVIPAYAHNFLISGILSPEYVDITGDGITEDDLGEAVKFNYSRLYGRYLADAFNWRAPSKDGFAVYNEGLITDSRDDKGSVSYGSKEIWYLNSIESKTMIATFTLADREDVFSVLDEEGSREINKPLKKLVRIDLYSKSDYSKNGTLAKPIKSVVFTYNHNLTPNTPSSNATGKGKLTLERIHFEYNGNTKNRKNDYVFNYQKADQQYVAKQADRWGNYKNASLNPGSANDHMDNGEYPYTIQPGMIQYNKQIADEAASVWTLNEIKLPSSGKIKVSYEQDDYSFVQNRRAMQLFEIAGFGTDSSSTPENNLWPANRKNPATKQDFQYVFVKVTEPVTTKAQAFQKYLDGVTKLYFKIKVKMPSDKWGSGYEIVPVYAEILDYGIKSQVGGSTMIWLKLKDVKGGESAIATAAVQFLRLNLPSKAYPYSEPGDKLDFKTLVQTLATVGNNVRESVSGFAEHARNEKFGREVKLAHSFVRLNNPNYCKLGGGLRVKKVEIYDNWSKMTNQQMSEAVYGQQYNYTTEADINGELKQISSGVASYEPGIGGDENPFKVPAAIYPENVTPLAPVNLMYSEEPFGETFFPAAVVGYSKVTVSTIHGDKKSATGKEISEFYTGKDFPTIVEYTPLDDDSRKPYFPLLANIFKFNARNEITLSQGFKIELNDMHGKLKSQASFSQADEKTPISRTVNYYRLQKDQALRQKLSNEVDVVDSANGIVIRKAEVGKDVEIMLDIRQQISSTKSASIEVNFDWLWYFPPASIGMVFAMPSSELNQYRSVSVLKIVNRNGILDSVIHIEKGSQVSTKNILFDGETGEALLSETNNEFDDPIYNFSYPAHWAYSGMGMAYKNIGSKFSDKLLKDGRLFNNVGGDSVAVSRHFESGDEILLIGSTLRTSAATDPCAVGYHEYNAGNQEVHKVWAIDGAKGKEKHSGIFFIDKNGKAFSGYAKTMMILRSGKRNLPSVSIGNVSLLSNPIHPVNGKEKLIFDSLSMVLNSASTIFKDVWSIDSTTYKKDTIMMGALEMIGKEVTFQVPQNGLYSINAKLFGDARRFETEPSYPYFESMSYYKRGGFPFFKRDERGLKSWMRFDVPASISRGSVVVDATIFMRASSKGHLHQRSLNNEVYISRLLKPWPRTVLGDRQTVEEDGMIRQFYEHREVGAVEVGTRILVESTPKDSTDFSDMSKKATNMVQGMIDDYWTYNLAPAVAISFKNSPNDDNGKTNQRSYYGVNATKNINFPKIVAIVVPGCTNGIKPTLLNGRYVCYQPVDSFVCRPITDTMMNPYRWGIFGNWRVDRSYTYYDSRKETDPNTVTDTRIHGQISKFTPFWEFTSQQLEVKVDTAVWVWNSESTRFNRKSLEIENHDPLDRYNSGQYGYNQTLPVAVAQNSKSREMLFEGFEDYTFKTNNCIKCNDYRFADFSPVNISELKAHTGKSSLRIEGNQTIVRSFPVASITQDTASKSMSLKLDSTAIVKTKVTGLGTGLQMVYRDLASRNRCNNGQPLVVLNNMNVDYYWYNGIPNFSCTRNRDFQVTLKGYIQPRFSGSYKFYAYADDVLQIYITRNGVEKRISKKSKVESGATTRYEALDTITFVAGELYSIRIEHFQELPPGFEAHLQWESFDQVRETVPVSQLYHPTTNIATAKASSVTTETSWCVGRKGAKPTGYINPRFSPISGKKMIISTWVSKEGECIPEEFQNIEMRVGFNNSSAMWSAVMLPAGPLIDGWQRIESEITIPTNATTLQIEMKTTSNAIVFFDDMRLYPVNSAMKSYVYDPVTLRLMAELDDNNYATFYEYDDDGTLIRVKKETERGVKTIKETRSALAK